MQSPPVRGHVPTLTNPVPNYGQIVTLGCPSECPSYVAMVLWGKGTPIMPVHRRKRPVAPSTPHNRQQCGIYGNVKNLSVKDLLSTSREDIQKIKTKKTSIAISGYNIRKAA